MTEKERHEQIFKQLMQEWPPEHMLTEEKTMTEIEKFEQELEQLLQAYDNWPSGHILAMVLKELMKRHAGDPIVHLIKMLKIALPHVTPHHKISPDERLEALTEVEHDAFTSI